MEKKVTVKQAIKRGHQMVNYPIFGILVGGVFIGYFLSQIHGGLAVLCAFATFGLMWLWWSVMITKWRIWAFSNVRNVHELKQRAINEKLIWPDDSEFNKTEIRSKEQEKKLREINKKFEQPDEIEIIKDDGLVGDVTVIRYSIFERITNMILPFVIVGIGVFLMFENKYIFGGLMLLVGVYMFFDVAPKYFINKPQIIISQKGIQAIDHDFLPWTNIEKFYPRLEGSGKNSSWYLDVELFEEEEMEDGQKDRFIFTESILLDELDQTPDEIEELAKLYRQRHGNHKKTLG